MGYSTDPGKYELGIVRSVQRACEGHPVVLNFSNKKFQETARVKIHGYITALKCSDDPLYQSAQGLTVIKIPPHSIRIIDREETEFAQEILTAFEQEAKSE